MAKRFIVSATSVALVVLILLGTDAIVGKAANFGLLYTPGASISYKTSEFEYTARINELGFRGPETPTDDCRVMAIGDSFTFGWGIDHPWPELIDALNLGLPGAGPNDYAAIAERAVPSLHPDLIIVAMLQGDDMRQALNPPAPLPIRYGNPVGVLGTLNYYWPNITRLLLAPKVVTADQMRATWLQDARQVKALSGYAALPADVRQMVETGNLNPALVSNALNQPDYFTPATEAQIAATTKALAKIESFGVPVLVIAVPYAAYVSADGLRTRAEIGFSTARDTLTATYMDEDVRRAATRAGVTFLDVTAIFRQSDQYNFFKWDGHFTQAGARLFADSIAPEINKLCKQVKR